ncbi:MAG: hypothetical protein ACI9YE_002209 [Psychroserpens sp.]|jgi:hypothetical protein
MKLLHKQYDKKVKAFNLLFEIQMEEYLSIAENILKSNAFQRRRVKSSSTVYSLLKEDLKTGCIIPPIVLALSKNTKGIFDSKLIEEQPEKLESLIKQHQNNLIILDGLQRTYTIRDLFNSLRTAKDEITLEEISKFPIRIEVYVGIDKLGILYRMLTLNSGQTPMSLRHQIEILYSDYLEDDLDGMKLLLEADDKTPQKKGEYKFKDVIEGFNSYIDRDYLTIDRNDILENIKTLEKLSKENQETDLFKEFLFTYNKLVEKLINKSENWEYRDGLNLSGQPFGKTAQKIFTKSQVMTGLGSAIGKLVDFESINEIKDVNKVLDDISIDDIDDAFNNLITKLDKIRTIAKKIGNDQRMFFHFLFRELFNKKGEAYLNFNKAIDEAYLTYQSKTL